MGDQSITRERNRPVSMLRGDATGDL